MFKKLKAFLSSGLSRNAGPVRLYLTLFVIVLMLYLLLLLVMSIGAWVIPG